MAKRLDFTLDFSLDFSATHISATHVSEKYFPSQIFTITNIPLNETLLRMLSLDFLDKVAKRLDFLLSKKSSEKSSRLART